MSNYDLKICRSMWAIADPDYWKNYRDGGVCCIRKDGTLDEEAYISFLDKAALYGADMTRVLPWMVNEDWTTINPIYMPWEFDAEKMKYDLEKFNPVYFDNLSKMAFLSSGRGIVLYFCFFDSCHGNRRNAPWNKDCNIQGVDSFYDESTVAVRMKEMWIQEALKALSSYVLPDRKEIEAIGLVYGVSAANEPNDKRFESTGLQVMKAAFSDRWKIPVQRIEVGARYSRIPFSGVDPVFQKFSLRLGKEGIRNNEKFFKRYAFFKVIHHVTPEFLRSYRHIQRHTSRFWISDDGNHPKWTKEQWRDAVLNFLRSYPIKKNRAVDASCPFCFEALWGMDPGTEDAHLGIAEAFHQYSGVKKHRV